MTSQPFLGVSGLFPITVDTRVGFRCMARWLGDRVLYSAAPPISSPHLAPHHTVTTIALTTCPVLCFVSLSVS